MAAFVLVAPSLVTPRSAPLLQHRHTAYPMDRCPSGGSGDDASWSPPVLDGRPVDVRGGCAGEFVEPGGGGLG